MKGRIKEDDSSVPAPDGAFEYFSRYEIGAQHPRHVRRPRGGNGDEQVLLRRGGEAKGKAYYAVDAADHSPDHALYALAVDEQGSEYHRILVQDLATGEILAERTGERIRRLRLLAGFAVAVLDLARRERPAGQGLPPPGARRRGRAGLRGA